MADESVENRDPESERSGQSPQDDEIGPPDRSSSRRHMIVTGLLTAPVVMTLGARSARSKKPGKDPTPSCTASINPSHHCM
jgi:hypothetical protein